MSSKNRPGQKTRGKPFGPDHRGKPGRRAGTRNMATIVKAFAEEMHEVTEDGRRVKRSSTELLIKALLAKAMQGNVAANRYLEGLRDKLSPPDTKAGFLVVPETSTQEEWIRTMEARNALSVEPELPEALLKRKT